MKFLYSYLKCNAKWIWGFLLCEGILFSLMISNRIPAEEVLYGIVLGGLLLTMISLVDFVRQWHHYRSLLELEHSVTFSLDTLAPSDSMLEQEYQKLLHLLFAEKLRQENESLDMQKDMREYYAMWVHQIKTPISALKLLLQEKSSGGEMEEELRELFSVEQYVEMVLQYARLESESMDFVVEHIKLDQVIRSSVRKYARMFVHKKISLEYDGTQETVLSDKKWLQFVIEQILSNAIKYTAKGKISICLSGEGTKNLSLVIADTGIGIKEEDLPRICEKGYTGYNGHADRRSTGIGLYLVKRTLDKLGHGFSVTSKEGAGTRVEIGFEIRQEN